MPSAPHSRACFAKGWVIGTRACIGKGTASRACPFLPKPGAEPRGRSKGATELAKIPARAVRRYYLEKSHAGDYCGIPPFDKRRPGHSPFVDKSGRKNKNVSDKFRAVRSLRGHHDPHIRGNQPRMAKNTSVLPSFAESKAQEAQSLAAFGSLNLLSIRTAVSKLLAQIGRNGLFEQYTVHDISHINKMLKILEWLTPETTKRVMTPADWLMTVLAIYFHDLGMVITRNEFAARLDSDYREFRKSVFRGEQGEDYRAKVQGFSSSDESERFLYQEFVRQHHAQRVKLWLCGQDSAALGVSSDAAAEVRKLVEPLGEKFCRDLGLVCESHHLDDLFDTKKYKLSQPYGDDPKETVNLQYAALLLRCADLLHVTRDRTPSITFRLINPTDPVSVEEWRKQMAVVSVRSKIALDKEGNADQSLARNTIEVHATFNDSGGFFALTSYLQYVRKELKQCHDWAKAGQKQTGLPYEFPWKFVDDSNVETHGFLSKQFEFTLDQSRILDLLTGHTLYNDISVVLRELVQNSIDAIRLQAADSEEAPGAVHIRWTSKDRTLVVEDAGTGMSQRTIEEHLLKVGSSLYQDPEFQKRHPTFSPISRFGIGVLSTFMIGDEVEIVTCHPDDEQARHLTLRSVHGRYLVKLVDKHKLPASLQAQRHGTMITLRVRPSVRMPNVLETARLWIVVPNCDVFVSMENGPEKKVGFPSVKSAVEAYYGNLGYRGETKILEAAKDGVEVAFVVRWNEFFREWEFVQPQFRPEEERHRPPLGLCVEGIRVTFGTPGFTGHPIVAIANAKGPSAPRTNVARSGLESTPQRDTALSAVYHSFCAHVTSEVTALHRERHYSLTWATKEAKFLADPVNTKRGGDGLPEDSALLLKELSDVPALLVEEDKERKAISASKLSSSEYIWTIDCPLFESAESMLREVPGSSSLYTLSQAVFQGKLHLESDPILSGFQPKHILR
jgi:molecular chaperone HtpG